jgi:hypothetical protein
VKTKIHTPIAILRWKGKNRDTPKLEYSNLKRKRSKVEREKFCKERKHFAKKRAFINTGYI